MADIAHSFYQLMHEKDEWIKSIIETVGVAVITIDIKGTIQTFNAAAEKLFGYRAYEVVGKKSKILVPSSYEAIAKHKDGKNFPIDLNITPCNLNGERLFTWIIKDITNIKEVEDQLRHTINKLEKSNQELSQITFISSHDLQEPLRLVASYMQLLANRYQHKLDAEANEYIDFAIQGVKRMKALTHDLVTYAEVCNENSEFKEVNLDSLLDSVNRSLKSTIDENQAAIIHKQLPVISGNSHQLKELFSNLINNAIRYRSEAAPEIHISAERQGNHWLIAIQDNGIGIKAEHTSKIFNIFQRLDKKDEDCISTGIGLSICKKIVEKHRGEIWVESEIGKGSTFYVTLNQIDEQE